MPAVAFVIRSPNGDYEYDLSRRVAPTIGETIGRRGVLWSVTDITHADVTTAHVEHLRMPAHGEPSHGLDMHAADENG
jgi:hypothetical protein